MTLLPTLRLPTEEELHGFVHVAYNHHSEHEPVPKYNHHVVNCLKEGVLEFKSFYDELYEYSVSRGGSPGKYRTELCNQLKLESGLPHTELPLSKVITQYFTYQGMNFKHHSDYTDIRDLVNDISKYDKAYMLTQTIARYISDSMVGQFVSHDQETQQRLYEWELGISNVDSLKDLFLNNTLLYLQIRHNAKDGLYLTYQRYKIREDLESDLSVGFLLDQVWFEGSAVALSPQCGNETADKYARSVAEYVLTKRLIDPKKSACSIVLHTGETQEPTLLYLVIMTEQKELLVLGWPLRHYTTWLYKNRPLNHTLKSSTEVIQQKAYKNVIKKQNEILNSMFEICDYPYVTIDAFGNNNDWVVYERQYWS